MRVGIIGTGWGRVHCGTFRAAGCEIAALVGRRGDEVAAIAAEEGVPVAATSTEALEACDVVVIASPTTTHLEYLHRFRDKPVLCEKPLCGEAPEPDTLARLTGATHFVNYAFPFLDTAVSLDALLDDGRLGSVGRLLLEVGVRFPASKSPAEWFVDVVAHPLSYLLHRYGEFALERHYVGAGVAAVSTVLCQPGRQLDVALYALPVTGIRIDLKLIGTASVARLSGGYQPGRGWWFEPLLVDDAPVSAGEVSDAEDIWIRANHRAVALFCDVVRGRVSRAEALARGGFDLEKAIGVERMLGPLLRAG